MKTAVVMVAVAVMLVGSMGLLSNFSYEEETPVSLTRSQIRRQITPKTRLFKKRYAEREYAKADRRAQVMLKSAPFAALCPSRHKSEAEKDEILLALHEAALLHQVEPELLAAVMIAESGCKTSARSSAGAQGLMQLMPSTSRWLGVSNPLSPKDNVMGAAKYLAQLLRDFSGNRELALAAYNAGPYTVKKHRRIPPIRETKVYVQRVLAFYKEIRQSTRTVV